MNWQIGDRVRLTTGTPFTPVGAVGTIVRLDMPAVRPFRVELDDTAEPFDLIEVRPDEIEAEVKGS